MTVDEKVYIASMAKSKRIALLEHIRPQDNEWMIEEMHEFVDAVNVAAYRSFKANIMSKGEYQETVAAAMDEWLKLVKEVKAHEGRN